MFVTVVLILKQYCGRYKYPFFSVHTDLLRSKKPSVLVNIHFERCFCKPPFLCVFVRSSVNGFVEK